MDFLFAIPSSIFHLVLSFFSLIWGIIVGSVGILIWPVKLVWGLVIGAGKLIISILLAPILLFYHPAPANVTATQPVTVTIPAISNSSFEQIFNDINQLELAGREMEYSRHEWRSGNSTQCGTLMRDYQNQAEKLVERTKALPMKYKITLGAAATRLNSCVSCSNDAQKSCDLVRMDLSDFQSMMSEE